MMNSNEEFQHTTAPRRGRNGAYVVGGARVADGAFQHTTAPRRGRNPAPGSTGKTPASGGFNTRPLRGEAVTWEIWLLKSSEVIVSTHDRSEERP